MAERGDTAILAAIIAAKSAGASWASIASAQGLPNGKAAKKRAKALAREANRRLLMQAREDGGEQ